MPITHDHSHECRGCGATVACCVPSDECQDHPGDCDTCAGCPPPPRPATRRPALPVFDELMRKTFGR